MRPEDIRVEPFVPDWLRKPISYFLVYLDRHYIISRKYCLIFKRLMIYGDWKIARTQNPRSRTKLLMIHLGQDKCKKCGSKERLTIDHKIPKRWGGRDNKENLQILCERCNHEKGCSLIEV